MRNAKASSIVQGNLPGFHNASSHIYRILPACRPVSHFRLIFRARGASLLELTKNFLSKRSFHEYSRFWRVRHGEGTFCLIAVFQA